MNGMRRMMVRMGGALLLYFIGLFPCVGHAADPCLACHEQKTPGIVRYWKASAHAGKVGCAGCHGDSVEKNHRRTNTVTATVCASCHPSAASAHAKSRHGLSIASGRGCTRNLSPADEQRETCALCHEAGSSEPRSSIECAMFLAQSPEMRRQGCSACHQIESRCDTCHTSHGTDLTLARDPAVCGSCHMGPDHPQYEMWESSRHGVIYRQKGIKDAPSCVTCHMRAGTHDVSAGIATRATGSNRQRERDAMVGICAECHTSTFARRNLGDADTIAAQSAALLDEAKGIVAGLQADGLLSPSPRERPAHPLFNKTFVIGPHMLYENLSQPETDFFRMMMFYAPTSYKGIFHQNPDYAHWYGNAPLKLSLSELKSNARLLRDIGVIKKQLDALVSSPRSQREDPLDIRGQLRALAEQRLKGTVTEEQYQARKKRLLDSAGL